MGLLQKSMVRNEPERMTNGTVSVTMGPERMGQMDLVFAFLIFLICVAACMVLGASLSWALLVGLVCFALVGLRRGYSVRELGGMAAEEMKAAGKVLRILLLIGLLTALWRAGGTVAFFVRTGVSLITPNTFLLVAFLLPALFSMAFGSSFGVVGTAGVILMTIARSGGANLLAASGAIMSGIYVGERLSPASSAAAVAAAVAGVDDRAFRSRMWRDTLLPFSITLLLYGVLSPVYPIHQVDGQILQALSTGFDLSWPVILPAVALLALPWMKVSAVGAILVSCVLSALCALLIQHMDPGQLLWACVTGYEAVEPELRDILSGGGLCSMLDVAIIVVLSCAYSGLFSGTGFLDPVTEKMGGLIDRIGLFATHVLLSLGTCMLFCNQTVGTVLSAQLTREEYRRRDLPPMEMAANIGNSVINLAGLVPWAIACSVPLATMGVGLSMLPFACYLYLLPLCCWAKEIWKGRKKTGKEPAGKMSPHQENRIIYS